MVRKSVIKKSVKKPVKKVAKKKVAKKEVVSKKKVIAKKPAKKQIVKKPVSLKKNSSPSLSVNKKNNKSKISALNVATDYVALAVVDAESYQKTNVQILKEMVQSKIPGVYVTLNRPYENMKRLLEKEKVDLSQVIFIDAVTKTAGGKIQKREDCLFIGSPKNLSDVSIAMDQAVMAIKAKEKYLFFDSLSTLLLYNSVDVVAQFVHFMSGKMRVWKIKGIIISLRREKDKDLIEQLKIFCDLTLNL